MSEDSKYPTRPSPSAKTPSTDKTTAYDLATLTTEGFSTCVDDSRPFVILLPVGSVEPHGPHLSLVTDTVISRGACQRAAHKLEQHQIITRIAPAVPYGVTECAARFKGAVSIDSRVLTAYIRAVVAGFLRTGVDHVCVINNHLEPQHDAAVRDAISEFASAHASVACPLTPRWGRTLSAEFKSGACHAGRYETSMVMAQAPNLVDDSIRQTLPQVPISLSDKLRAGVSDFVEMGLDRAYAGDPARATHAEGIELLERLAVMIVTLVCESLGTIDTDQGA